ncbi:hypothetical protein [Bremerella cremea]|uniref:hypothetical protein n=1 Tax=Bremerella cremea TaxID=1031537 RepID=UPI0031EEB4D7
MIRRRVVMIICAAVLLLGTSLELQAGQRFRIRRSSTPHYSSYAVPQTRYATAGYEYQTSRYQARTTAGYLMLFGM